MSERSNGERQGIYRRLAARYGDAAGRCDREIIVIHGRQGVTVHGVRRIALYSPCEIRLCVGRRTVSIRGERLFCASFSAGTVTVSGQVMGVMLLGEEAREC